MNISSLLYHINKKTISSVQFEIAVTSEFAILCKKAALGGHAPFDLTKS